jgi:hypothetical protein
MVARTTWHSSLSWPVSSSDSEQAKEDEKREDACELERIVSIDLLDLIVCLTLSRTSLSHTSDDADGQFCRRIYDLSLVQNPAAFRWLVICLHQHVAFFVPWQISVENIANFWIGAQERRSESQK